MHTNTDNTERTSGYADVNGLNMYYEIYGQGQPLVLIHGGGSTIQTSFGRIIPGLAINRQLIAVELQAHGRTSDRDKDSSFEQDADDVAELLRQLRIYSADFFGFSNGGTTTLQIAIRHPAMTRKIIVGSALTKRSGAPAAFWDFMRGASLSNMPQLLQEGYLQVAPNEAGLQVMHDRDAKRMVEFKDIPDELLQSIKCPTLIINADQDVITNEHALELHRLIVGSQLAILPGTHGEYMGEITTLRPDALPLGMLISLIDYFLD